MKNPNIDWRRPEHALNQELTSSAVTDCKSLFDLCVKTTIPSCSEQRTTLECLIIRERLKENVLTRWIHSKGQLADCLTKAMDARALRDCLASGRYALYDESATLKERENKREAIGWYKQQTEQHTQEKPHDHDNTL